MKAAISRPEFSAENPTCDPNNTPRKITQPAWKSSRNLAKDSFGSLLIISLNLTLSESVICGKVSLINTSIMPDIKINIDETIRQIWFKAPKTFTKDDPAMNPAQKTELIKATIMLRFLSETKLLIQAWRIMYKNNHKIPMKDCNISQTK